MNAQAPSSGLKLMVLAPFAPRLDAPHGGGRVLAQFLLEMSQTHPVALLYLRARNDPPVDPILKERCALVQGITRNWAGPTLGQKILRNLRLAAALLLGRPMWVGDWASPAFARLVRTAAAAWQPDLVQIEYHIMAQYLPALKGCRAPRVLVEYEAALRAGPFLQAGPEWLHANAHHLDRRAWQSFEARALRQVQAVVVFTPQDRQALMAYEQAAPVRVIPAGFALAQPVDPGPPPETPGLLFVGNYNHPPNREAALRLVERIYPGLREKHPGLRCILVGPDPPPGLLKQACPGVTITGWVPELAPYFSQGHVFVAPLQTGGGMRIKLLEALAAGQAIVASPLACEGLQLQDGEHLLLADSDAEFIQRIEELLANPRQRAGLAAHARDWACAHLNGQARLREYEQLYQALLHQEGK